MIELREYACPSCGLIFRVGPTDPDEKAPFRYNPNCPRCVTGGARIDDFGKAPRGPKDTLPGGKF